MDIHVQFKSQLKKLTQQSQNTLSFDTDTSLFQLLTKLCNDYGDKLTEFVFHGEQVNPGLLVFVNGQQVPTDNDQALPENAQVILLSAMAGG